MRPLTILLLAFLGLAIGVPSAAQQATRPEDFQLRKVESVLLDDVAFDVQQHRVDLYFRALTRYGEPVTGLRPKELSLSEDDRDIPDEDIKLQSLAESHRGISAVLAIDNSRTMEGEPFERARDAALQFMDRLSAEDRVAVVSFAGSPVVVAPFDMARATARVHVQSLEIEPNSLNTTLFDALYRAVELLRNQQDIPRRAIVIVLSDGNDGGSTHTLEQAVELARGSETRPRVLIFSIGHARFGRSGLRALQTISQKTGADFFEASSAAQLQSFYKQIFEQMMESYVLSFPTDLDGKGHALRLAIEGKEDRRLAVYPDVPTNWGPWLAAGVGTLLVAAAALLFALRLRGGAGRLVFSGGPLAGQTIRLRRGRTRIGALEDNDIVIDQSTISRYHAEIRSRGREVEIEDLRSRNGIRVNGRAVKRSPLSSGDRISLADVEAVYER